MNTKDDRSTFGELERLEATGELERLEATGEIDRLKETDGSGFCDRLRSLIPARKENEFARSCGISPNALRHSLKTGNPGRAHLIAMARAGGVSVEWLATGEGPMHPTAGPASPLAAHAAGQTQYQGPLDGVREAAGPWPTTTQPAVTTGDSGVKLAVALAVAALGDPSQALRPERLADLVDAAHQLLQAGADPELVRRLIAAAAQP